MDYATKLGGKGKHWEVALHISSMFLLYGLWDALLWVGGIQKRLISVPYNVRHVFLNMGWLI
jgi:hypothetical protein